MSKTWRYILTTLVYIATAAALAAYFYAAGNLHAKERKKEVCKTIKVTLLDSAVNRFVTPEEIAEVINSYHGNTIGMAIDSIDLQALEHLLNRRSVVKHSEVSVTRDGLMEVKIIQRKPILRVETDNGGFYMDQTAFMFPLIQNYTSYVPVVSGHIPAASIMEEEGAKSDSLSLLQGLLNLGNFLENNKFWNAQVEQVYFEQNGDAVLFTRLGEEKIILGELTDIEEKFRKLNSYYKYIVPQIGNGVYASVNLKFRGQIVCRKATKSKSADAPSALKDTGADT